MIIERITMSFSTSLLLRSNRSIVSGLRQRQPQLSPSSPSSLLIKCLHTAGRLPIHGSYSRRHIPSRSYSTAKQPTNSFDTYVAPSSSVDHLIVGGGVVGLAIGADLVNRPGLEGKSTIVVERNEKVGMETSSRNSEVIHAGIYYPLNSLKSRYCIRGREMMYERCERLGIPHKKCQKLILATSRSQIEYIDQLHAYLQHPSIQEPGVPTYFLGPNDARDLEPDLGPNVLCALLSTESGVVDSHALMESLEREILESDKGDGEVVLGTKVVRIDPYRDESGGRATGPEQGWVVQLLTEGSDQPDAILTKTLILSAGLNAVHLLNPLLPENERLKAYYAKGPGVENVQRLLYPCPQEGLAGLGTHLTIDMAGNIKFGPDVEYIAADSHSPEVNDPDFWKEMLSPNAERKDQMAQAVMDYLPNIDPDRLTPDYAGIRPKLAPPGSPFHDFVIQYNPQARPGLIALCGVESPGLTSSLAIGQDIGSMVARDIWSS